MVIMLQKLLFKRQFYGQKIFPLNTIKTLFYLLEMF